MDTAATSEDHVIGAILEDPSLLTLLEGVTGEIFDSHQKGIILDAAIKANGEGIPLDRSSIISILDTAGNLDRAGGLGYVLELADSVPSTDPTLFKWHLGKVKESAFKRSLGELLHKASEEAKNGIPAAEIVEKVKAGLDSMDKDLGSKSSHSTEQILIDSMTEAKDFCLLEIGEQSYFIDPWLRAGIIASVIAPRGIGKTFLLIAAAMILTHGGTIGSWTVKTPTGVLYLDGEMPAYEQQKRLKAFLKILGPSLAPFQFLSSDLMQKAGHPAINLCDPKWRDAVYKILKEWDSFGVLIIDNVSCLFPGLDENSKQDWDIINQWLLSIRFLDVAVIFVHHAGKNGDQRGTSGREDNIDIAIKLSHPPGYRQEDGAKFKVEFSKARGIYGKSVEPFTSQIIEQDGGLTWTTEKPGESSKELIIALLGSGIAQKDIPNMLNCSRGWVSRVKKEAINQGFMKSNGHLTSEGIRLCEGVDVEGFTL